jgi:hypothetical protein
MMNAIHRRRFLKNLGAGAGLICLASGASAVHAAADKRAKLFVGVQVRKRSFDQRGIGPVIDDLVKTVGMNAIISIDVAKAEDIRAVAEAAAQRSVRYFPAKFEWSGLAGSVDAFGKTHPQANCPLDPIASKARSQWYENAVDALPETAGGLLFGHEERMPPLHSALGGDPGGCFCEVCTRRGKERGVDVDRAQTGFQRIHGLTQQCRSGQVPSDGAFVSLWRIFTDYPEVFAWDRLWFDALVEVRKGLRDMVRAKKPKLELGWHINHPVTLSPFFRARYDYNDYVGIADWIKPSIYHDCGGARFRGAWSGFHKAILADLDRETALRFMYGVLNMDAAREPALADYDQKDVRPFSEEYVAREVRRGLAGLKGRVPLYPGIGIDIPSPGAPPTSPETVYKCTKAALEAGAQGIMISRHLDEMQRANLEAAGRAIKERL